ncbi:MAG: TonB family protein [Verrucomicrobiales bacterium]|nr:TonB family protein [Verrucomicrobiales bacterium]MDB6130713.1 TonB family protein [Verrucomicrobiales bacterium]
MTRLQKKCVIGASAMHGLLIAIVIFAPGFAHKEEPTVPIITYLETTKMTDSPSRGGNPGNVAPLGDPKVKEIETKPVEQPPVHKPEVPPVVEKSTPPDPVKPKVDPTPIKLPDPPKVVDNKDPDDMKVVPKPPKKNVKPDKPVVPAPIKETPVPKKPVETHKQVSLGPIVHKDTKAIQEAKDRADRVAEQKKAEAEADATRQKVSRGVENGLRGVLANLGKNLSSSTSVEVPGVGGGGQASVNYKEMVLSRYQKEFENAVLESSKTLNSDNTVEVLVTVNRSGNISNSKITRASGNVPLDRVVNAVLRKVTSLPAFPEGASENERVFRITFDLKTIQQSG